MNYKQAISTIKSRRKNDILLYETQYLSALRENPELKRIDMAIYDIKSQKTINNEQLQDLTAKRDKILERLKLNPPEFNCQICLDTGIKNSKPCSCVIKLMFASNDYKHTFDDFDLDVFNESDKPISTRAFKASLAFCQKFPHTTALNLVILGATGTGKTFLASCIGDRLTKQGFSVIFCSSFSFVNRMLGYHTAPINEKLDYISPIIDCDLLIVDDLGTESMLKNVTSEYFYMILNERMRLNRHTLITTNLDNEMIMTRYGERFMSRLFDKRLSRGFSLGNTDLRKRN